MVSSPLHRLTAVVLPTCLIMLVGACPPTHHRVSITWGPEVEVPGGPESGMLRTEPSVVLADSTVVVAWNDSYGGAHGASTGVAVAWAISYDFGAHFSFGGFLTPDDSGRAPDGADSWLARASDGSIYLQVLGNKRDSQEILLYTMPAASRGRWSAPVTVVQAQELDKPAMATGAVGEIAVAYTSADSIAVVRTRDAGAHWSPPVRVSTGSTGEGRTRLGAGVAWCGDSILIAWMEGEKAELTELWLASSTDNGRTFSHARMAYRLTRPVTPPAGYALGLGPAAFISNNAWVACGTEVGHSPRFYVSIAEGGESGSSILLFEGLVDSVAASPIRVTSPADPSPKVFPSVAVAANVPALLYYDRRLSPGTSGTDVYLSIRVDRDSFADHRVTLGSTDWDRVPGDREFAPIQRNFGDYIFLAADGSRFIAAWTDGRSGKPRIVTRTGTVHR